jgi:L-fuculose-phosphate aldolase
MSSLDLTARGVIAIKDVDQAATRGVKEIVTRKGAVITPLALDALQRRSIAVREDGAAAPSPAGKKAATGTCGANLQRRGVGAPARDREALFRSPEAQRIKEEIVAVGKKLWHRQYVDGNGGNISYRIGPNEVLCTPTLCSKFDLTPDLICMVDLEGNQLAGTAARTSEIFLHLEIYKAVPEAKGVVHCHPPHATAYAITGRVPPSGIVPEFDVFVGAVALSPYETPGTQRFAETVLPFVKNYNTVLLGNHGIVCWADTVTHAEWYAEVLETYCWTLTIASTQLGVPVSRIPAAKTQDLLSIKKRLGLPDPRFTPDACPLAEVADDADGITLMPPRPCQCAPGAARTCPAAAAGRDGGGEDDVESIVRDVTEAVMTAIEARGRRG